MRRSIAMLGTIAVVLSLDVQAQIPEGMYRKAPALDYSTFSRDRQEASRGLTAFAPAKKPGHYTVQDWRALIDSFWGPGPSTATKLQIFDFFWDLIDKQYAGFPHLAVNWDSLKTVYRPQIEAGVSRGRFWGIMGRMYMSLQEIHTWMSDIDLDAYFMDGGKLVYKPGIPAFFPSGWGWAGSFGAALTPLPDSSLLVYRALAGHPLGIVPGDIVLGYDRIPWKQLYPELLSVEFPIEWWGETWYGSSLRSMTHGLLGSAGSNWGLFDTVDVVKYSTGDTIHLPTAPLASLDYLSLFATEQVAVPGVMMPDYPKGERITWGVVDGTSVGYIYAYCWDAAVGPVFESAVRDLVTVRKVTGLVLDFRYNVGTKDSWTAANAGLDYLFNADPISPSRARTATRVDPNNHFGFSFSPPPGSFQPSPNYYDRPIAVLTGPQALSMGDHVPFRMRSHPMVRFFGLPTNGAFIVGGLSMTGPVFGNWYYRYAAGQLQSLVNNEGFLMHNTPPVDEEVWLTRDGVARGEDDVVKRALGWITTLTYAHDVALDHTYRRTGQDSVSITARLSNPLNHTALLTAALTDASGVVRDSVRMYDDGLHGDGQAADSVWGGRFREPPDEGMFGVNVRVDDITKGTSWGHPNAAHYFTLGPVQVDRLLFFGSDTIPNPGNTMRLVLKIKNFGLSVTAQSVRATLTALDTFLVCSGSTNVVQNLAPGLTADLAVGNVTIKASTPAGTAHRIAVGFSSNGYQAWDDTIAIDVVTGVAEEEPAIPATYALEQNYPNPFNPTTGIRYQVSGISEVKLVVYDMLGREVAVLVNEKKAAGNYQVNFDASGLASGVYIYRLSARQTDGGQTGSFVQSRKMLLAK